VSVTRADRPPIQLELDSDPRYLAGARELVAAVARRLGFGELDCSRIALAVDEALANVICHGYQRDPRGRIWLRLATIDPPDPEAGVWIVIEDEGKQVDADQIRGRDLADVRPGGLGVHIIHEVMDEVRYEKRERVGMRLTMVKRLERPEGSVGDADRSDGATGG